MIDWSQLVQQHSPIVWKTVCAARFAASRSRVPDVPGRSQLPGDRGDNGHNRQSRRRALEPGKVELEGAADELEAGAQLNSFQTGFSTMNDREPSDDLLDRAFESLRTAPVSDGPPPHVVASTVEAIHSSKTEPEKTRLAERRRIMFRIARFSGATAAALLLCFVVVWTLVIDRGANVAFADVIDTLKNVKSATCVNRQTIGRQSEMTFKMYLLPDRIRMENRDVTIVVVDYQQQKALQLVPPLKTAQTIELRGAVDPSALTNPLEQLQQLKPDDAVSQGEEMAGDRRLLIYKVEKAQLFDVKGPMTLWIDPKTELPVKIHIEHTDAKTTRSLTFEDFKWNEPFDKTLFSLQVPDGYTVGNPGGAPPPDDQ